MKKRKYIKRKNSKARINEGEKGIKIKDSNKKPPTLSACLIVKNEEELIPQCLESIKDFVDEIIIVDTGSTDRTVEIAKSYGAKIYHHPWENDFSKHRNQSIYYATGDWIFILDGDEKIVQWDRNLETITLNKNIDSIYVSVENIYGKGEGAAWHNSIRLFRNMETIRYTGRVHNQLTGYGSSAHSAILIYHTGYCLDPDKEEKKYLRTTTILEQEIEKDEENPKLHHYLAVAHLGKQLYGKALKESKKALDLASRKGKDDALYLWTHFVGAVSCLNTNQLGEAEQLCYEAIKTNPLHLDSHYLLSSLYYHQGKIQHFLDHSEKYLSLLNRFQQNTAEFGLIVQNTIKHEWRIRLHRGFAFTQLEKKEEADSEYSLSLKLCHDRSEYYKERSRFCLKCSEYLRAERFLKKVLKYNSEDKELLGLRLELDSRMEADKAQRKDGGLAGGGKQRANRPEISLCMMVKNEEDFLPQCLASVKDYVDEIIIVDTGSTDNTPKIAESYGAKIYFHSWEGDFSKHRNQSISYATKDWILIVDADEILSEGCGETIREAIKDESIDSVYVTVKSAFDKGRGVAAHNSIRIFRNSGAIHYEGRVHNRIVGEKKSKICPITFFHEGYNLPPEQSRKKFDRTTSLLKKDIEENPQHPRAYHYLAASYLSEEMYDKAIDSAIKAVTLAEEKGYSDFIYLWSHFIAGISYLKTDKLEEAEEICLRAIRKSFKHLDSHYLLTIIYFHKKNWQKVFHHSNEYLGLLERIQKSPGEFGPMVHSTINHQWRVHLHRGFAYTELKEKGKARRAFSRALDLCDDKGEYYKLLAIFYMRNSEFSIAERYLPEAIKYNPQDVETYRNGAQIYQKLGNRKKEKTFLEKVIERDSHDIDCAFRLGTIYVEEKCYTEAKELLEKVIAREPNHSGALINLGVLAKRSGDLDNALMYLEKALQISPNSLEALSNAGYAYYAKDNLLKAQQVFERLIQLDSTILDVHLALSMIYIRLISIELAVTECDVLLSLLGMDRNITLNSISDLSNLFMGIGKVLLERRESALASMAFKAAIDLAVEVTETLKKIAKICFEQGSYNTSLEYIEQAIRLKPQDWESFSLMGDCHTKMNAEEAATVCYQKARELNTPVSSAERLSMF